MASSSSKIFQTIGLSPEMGLLSLCVNDSMQNLQSSLSTKLTLYKIQSIVLDLLLFILILSNRYLINRNGCVDSLATVPRKRSILSKVSKSVIHGVKPMHILYTKYKI